MRFFRASTRIARAWLTALGILIQGIAAPAGGVLCVGCTNLWGGVAIASVPCTPARDCCAKESRPADDDADNGCGCFDLTLPPVAVTVAQQPPRLVLAFAHLAFPAPAIAAVHDIPSGQPLPMARAGPPIVRQLAPAARRTVLRM